MTPTEQYFPAPVFSTLYKVVLALESVDETFKSVFSIKSY